MMRATTPAARDDERKEARSSSPNSPFDILADEPRVVPLAMRWCGFCLADHKNVLAFIWLMDGRGSCGKHVEKLCQLPPRRLS